MTSIASSHALSTPQFSHRFHFNPPIHSQCFTCASHFKANYSFGSLRNLNSRERRSWNSREKVLHMNGVRVFCIKEERDLGQGIQFQGKSSVVSKNAENPSSNFLTLLCPLLKLFGGGDPSLQRNEFLEVATSSLSTAARFPWGSKSVLESSHGFETGQKPPQYLKLFEFEACPFCRRVREAMTELNLAVEVYPCPKGSLRHRQMVKTLGGKEQFPYLVDPNTGVSMYESGDIVKYLYRQYGQGRNPSFGLLESTLFTGWMPTILRAGRGMTIWEKAKPEPASRMLELFSYENNLYARIVREALCEMELPYILHNVGEGSPKSEFLFQVSGSKQIPFLVDPNTGAKLGDYKNILSYLFQTYSSACEN
ncbi:hypothetical protein AMTRI_Chr11g158130 [Amborella trichopoda]|uniref:GST N-terminal domain-containing protein n=1 Tax=Amborella trichopoda TaxID=13333 RepID=W1NWK3_AMBTC|nr:uncharacterized protein LOC18427690 [Amborella trichopoda]ERM99655.1 hypothetical protein AMTR_s00099p00023240 [Amborella trichopoda]|eukprot:XP_006836802.1 uncharacterized protein LOC18427690 [Amborella trichopoda]